MPADHPLLLARATCVGRSLRYGEACDDVTEGTVVAINPETGMTHLITDAGEVHTCNVAALRFDAEVAKRANPAEAERRKYAPTLAELQEDCRRAGGGPENTLALVKAYRARSGYGLQDAAAYVKRLLAAGGSDGR